MEFIKLTNKNISDSCNLIHQTFENCGVPKKSSISIELMMEEIMLNYQDKFSQDADFSISIKKRFSRHQITLLFNTPPLNPMNKSDSSDIMQNIGVIMGISPQWSYSNGINTISYSIKEEKKLSSITSLFISLSLALACGLISKFLPEPVQNYFANNIISPLFDTIMRMITCIAGPLIFLSVAGGIYNIGDIAYLVVIGRKMIGRFLSICFGLSLLALLCFLPFFNISAGLSGKFEFDSLYKMVLDIVPDNIMTPFATSNTLQIIYLAVIFGIAILILGKKTDFVTTFTEQINFIIQLIMDFISNMINIFVFMSIFNLMLNRGFTNISGIIKLLPLLFMGSLIVMGIYLCFTCIKHKISPLTLLKKQLPTFIIAISTASSSAAFSVNVECCQKKLGIDNRLIHLGIPLGNVIFAIGTSISFITIGLSISELSGISMTYTWLLHMYLISVVLAIATPPIPGGSIACFTIFASQLGLPYEALTLCITVSIITDFIATAVNIFCLQLELVEQSYSLNSLNMEILKKK